MRANIVDQERLERALESPLRLSLVACLLEASDNTLPLDLAVVQTASHVEDVLACLRPLAQFGVAESLDNEKLWRLRRERSGEVDKILRRLVREKSEQITRDRRVRREVLTGMIGTNPKMQVVAEMVRRVARLNVSVLIAGESGTGKELVARAIHELSPRHGAVFGDVNCANLSEQLFESHVFGHTRGAFTGAVQGHVGLVERCHNGTLFLDEVAELSPANQSKLLRVLQRKTFTPLGGTRARHSDFRLVSATNQDLTALIKGGGFREDLYYRINVFPINVPPLREHLDDLPFLAEEILAQSYKKTLVARDSVGVTTSALERLQKHQWPGNIRELENVLLRAAIAAEGGPVDVKHLPAFGTDGNVEPPPAGASATGRLRSLAEVERGHIEDVLEAVGGNITVAAETLQISRTTLYKKIRDHAIDIGRRQSHR